MKNIVKIIFVLLFIISLALNISLLNNLNAKDSTIKNLNLYKKAYIKMTDLLGVSPEQSEAFVVKTGE